MEKYKKKDLRIRLVGFDGNGTIFNDTPQFFEALNCIFDHFGKPRLSIEKLRECFTRPWTKIYRDAGITGADASDEELYNLYDVAYQAQPLPKPSPGLREALEWLMECGILAVIVSTQRKPTTERLLKYYDLSRFFSEVRGEVDDKAEELSQLLRKKRINAEEAIYIGDQDNDVQDAKRVGCIPIAFTGGVHDSTKLEAAGASILSRHSCSFQSCHSSKERKSSTSLFNRNDVGA